MSRTYLNVKNKHQNQSKVNYQAYINNPSEPREHINFYMLEELEAELVENSAPMRLKLRRLAQSLRRKYA